MGLSNRNLVLIVLSFLSLLIMIWATTEKPSGRSLVVTTSGQRADKKVFRVPAILVLSRGVSESE